MRELVEADLREIVRLAEAALEATPTELLGYIARIRRQSIRAWDNAEVDALVAERETAVDG